MILCFTDLDTEKMRTAMRSVAVTRKFTKIYSNTAEFLRASNYVDLAAIFKLQLLLDVLLKMRQPSLRFLFNVSLVSSYNAQF